MFVRPTFFIMKVSRKRLAELGEDAYVVALITALTSLHKKKWGGHTSRTSITTEYRS